MSKLLSQDEIDALLDIRQEIESGSEDSTFDAIEEIATKQEERISSYNFKRPKLFAQDQIRVLNHIHETFARDLSGYLSAQLRTIVDISLFAVDQVLYSEYVLSSAPPSALYIIKTDYHDQEFVFEFDPRLAVFVVEKLFGGSGVFLDQPRELSLIEQRIMDKILVRAFRELEKAWKPVHEVDLEKSGFESNAEFVQILPAVEPAIVVTLEILVYENRSLINICYPYILLERLLTRTGMKRWMSSMTSEVDPEVREQFEDTLRAVDVDMHAELGRTSVSLQELDNLEEGDIIPLQQGIEEPVDLFVEGSLRYRAAVGTKKKNRALKIVEEVNPPKREELTPELDSEYDENTASPEENGDAEPAAAETAAENPSSQEEN